NSKKGYLPMEVKHDLSNELCASTPKEEAYMKKVPYALAVGSIIHFLRRYHYVRQQVETGEIKLIKVHTDDNLADHFIKALPRGMVIDHAKGIGLQLASSFMHTFETGEIKLIKVHTDDNLADPFTKALPRGMVIDHA
nr:retrotransposon ribonuclease H [Tanacetum cinerariifolium]